MSQKLLFGFHAVTVRLKVAPHSIRELHVDASRHDQRMKQFLAKVEEAGLRVIESDDDRLQLRQDRHDRQGHGRLRGTHNEVDALAGQFARGCDRAGAGELVITHHQFDLPTEQPAGLVPHQLCRLNARKPGGAGLRANATHGQHHAQAHRRGLRAHDAARTDRGSGGRDRQQVSTLGLHAQTSNFLPGVGGSTTSASFSVTTSVMP